ncbi:uncharacterized protein SPPG_09257 [Spizellomyces punctatus DAOM BR117]|uniref:PNPLA domain-containing protein n=1 Tax=Spizellomyces punctatus (strain DAOM BR117) TaxID=645134 RepID=A0A0L0HFR0_SPIPD|nr:uncharacterized protein SPPG_09257 [Spizellomyces punctatus DAOM BR117]KNC99759.1 hypothetical protein SPPG_09257 [Spizellomyces punctatus DAOM BR117]|eukprot:XP_016607799.1 hypothetical protein SPPG_09257 [Spizellomyces punctatus DAOM BR117]
MPKTERIRSHTVKGNKEARYRVQTNCAQRRCLSTHRQLTDGGPHFFKFIPSQCLRIHQTERQSLESADLDYFSIYIAPASGPSGLTTTGFESRIKNLYAKSKLSGTKWLVGSSTGAMRFMALIGSLVSTERNLTEELMKHYCWMQYNAGDTPQILRPMMDQLYRLVAPPDLMSDILTHPQFRLAIIVSNIRDSYQQLPDWALRAVLGCYAVGNLVNERALTGLCERIVFYSGDEVPKFLANGFGGENNTRFVKLVKENVYEVLHGTTCIPFVQERCESIPGAGEGLYLDGALTDYMLNVQFTDPSHRALLLSDQPTSNVYPTALDAMFRWRTVPISYLEHCSIG